MRWFSGAPAFCEVTPALFQRLFVKPNELQLQKPYIEHNIG